jgi:hypothetical protein
MAPRAKPPLSGRRAEIEILLRLLESDRSEFLAVYGRRRSGKTHLIRRFFEDGPGLYLEVTGRFDGASEDQLDIFAKALSRTFLGGIDVARPPSWSRAFEELANLIERRRSKSKHILFFDELPWLATPKSGCLEALEHFWNAWCSKRSDIVLIVCGSAASWMLRKIVRAKGGLHNRLTQTIRLLPFTLAETKAYFGDRRVTLTDRQIVELYMCLGGIPHYLDGVRRGLSVSQAVDELCFQKDGALVQEFDRLYASLFDDAAIYGGVVRALSRRRGGLSRDELLAAVSLESGGGATVILENLEEGGFITSSIPFGRKSRDRFFRLTDEFSLFHLKWLDRKKAGARWATLSQSPSWSAWSGLAFESVCLKHFEGIVRALGISGIHTEVSSWRGEGGQIDLLIDRADGVISVCELKFVDGEFVITKKYANELRSKTAAFRAATRTRKAIQLVLVTPYGVAKNAHADELVDRSVTIEALF